MLNKEIKEYILRSFPKIELSYEKVLHKKVPADIYMLIPKGYKVFLWLTQWQEKNICVSISRNNNNEMNIYDYSCDFSKECAQGTILYGTLFEFNKKKHFSCEDIFSYKGQLLIHNNSANSLEQKLNMYKDLFINKHIYNNNNNRGSAPNLIIGLPVLSDNIEEAFQIQSQLPYPIYSIQLHLIKNRLHKIGAYLVKYGMPTSDSNPVQIPYKMLSNVTSDTILKVKACVQDDMYDLFCLDSANKEKYVGVAMISTYKASVMMNTIFRNIKENGNLDLLEESDDEDDFENMGENKYVDLEKSVLMKCVYAKRFKRWQPLSIFNGNEKAIISYNDMKKRE